MAVMSSTDGPFGPGLQRWGEDEKSSRYFRSTKARWNLSSVAGLTTAPSFLILCGLTNSVAPIADQKLMFKLTVTRKWTARIKISRMERTVPSPSPRARLHGAGELRHTTNSPPTGPTTVPQQAEGLGFRCQVLEIWRARQDLNPRPPGS